MRDLSPRPTEVPRTPKQRRWVAVWTVSVTDEMARLAQCLAAKATTERSVAVEAAVLYCDVIALRIPHFGQGSACTLVRIQTYNMCTHTHTHAAVRPSAPRGGLGWRFCGHTQSRNTEGFC
jgi:hypothetical protein